ncbi:hypothetical protein DL96DRAFT_1624074 [Flagelloscypha sp. PMI_526]|nr:hypothetical protein DL96DRAFT_1624074 [Flagelloscypha sp. PMI_526]
MPRRSTRLEAKPLPAAEDADSDTAGYSIEDPPPRKRRKTTNGPYSANKGRRAGKRLVKTASFDPKWRHTKGRQGLLKQLVTEAPLDVLFEIFAHLGLPDLLALSRSSKDLRALLLNKASPGTEALWTEAREAVDGLPEKPDEISEPEFASLMFGKTCMECGTNNVAHFMYRRRMCLNCFEANALRMNEMSDFLMDLQEESPGWAECLIYTASYHLRISRRHRETVRSKDEVRSFVAGYNEQPKGSRIEWLTQQQSIANHKSSFTSACRKWCTEKYAERRNDLDHLRSQRYDQIVAHLHELGWGDDFDSMDLQERRNFRSLKSVKKPQALTERMWENMRGEVVHFLENIQVENHRRRSRTNLANRLKTLTLARARYRLTVAPDTLVPPVFEIALLPKFSEVIEKDILQTNFPDDAFDALFSDNFASICNDWLHEKQSALLSSHSENTSDLSSLLLAKNDIVCSKGCLAIARNGRYPTPLFHSCFSSFVAGYDPTSLSLEDRISRALNITRPTLQLQTSAIAERFIRMCGLDPAFATYQEIMSLNPIFLCNQCSSHAMNSPERKLVLNYPEALLHTHICSTPQSGDVYKLLSSEEKILFGISSPPASLDGHGWEMTLYCRHCGLGFVDNPHVISQHMNSLHEILNPVRGTDYVVDHERLSVMWNSWSARATVPTSTPGLGE